MAINTGTEVFLRSLLKKTKKATQQQNPHQGGEEGTKTKQKKQKTQDQQNTQNYNSSTYKEYQFLSTRSLIKFQSSKNL